jgi:RNA polymerase sigma-70 factor (ECF subfamily)
MDALVRRHIGGVHAMIGHMVLNHADADDLTQEVFLRAARGLASFRGDAQFSTWLYRIAMNVARGFLKREGARVVYSSEKLPESLDPASPDAADEVMGRELDARITGAIAALSPALRAAIALTALHGLGEREAAAVEGCSVPAMYWRVHKARKMLRKRLRKDFE